MNSFRKEINAYFTFNNFGYNPNWTVSNVWIIIGAFSCFRIFLKHEAINKLLL